MLIRIVRLTFQPTKLDTFLDHFDAVAPRIRDVEGCQRLALWQDVRFPTICTTHSHWTDEAALQAYRKSDLFRTTWAEVKPWFAAPPEAHSYTVARPADAIAHRA